MLDFKFCILFRHEEKYLTLHIYSVKQLDSVNMVVRDEQHFIPNMSIRKVNILEFLF